MCVSGICVNVNSQGCVCVCVCACACEGSSPECERVTLGEDTCPYCSLLLRAGGMCKVGEKEIGKAERRADPRELSKPWCPGKTDDPH
jgi:hypothetical protein